MMTAPMTVEMMLVIVVQMTVKTALRIIHSHTMTLLKIQKMRMQEMRTLTKAWIQKAWPYMITCQLQGYSAGDAGIIRNGSTAKGTFYSVFETGEADGNTYENRLVYDRVSENGQCDLFVYEQLVSGSDTRLLGFYAVNKTTNEVFSADRNSWGGVSSREYQDATGEN